MIRLKNHLINNVINYSIGIVLYYRLLDQALIAI